MGLQTDFQETAQELCEEFGEDVGKSTLYHLTGEAYNTETGANTPTWTTHEAYMPEEKIKTGTFASTGFGSPEYYKDHRMITVAGLDLSVAPAIGDLVQPNGALVAHKVVYVDKDMYQAAYVLHVMKSPQEIPEISEED